MTDLNNRKEENYIPLPERTNYSEWYHCMYFLLSSKELLDVCKTSIGQDATPVSRHRWNKLSFEAINLITYRINQQVFLEVVRPETSDKADLLWTSIKKHYASKRNMNKGRVWMNWQKLNYTGHLQLYIDNTQKFLLDLRSISIELPLEVLLYIIIAKLGKDPSLTQVVEMITLKNNLLKKPDQALWRLKEYASVQTEKVIPKESPLPLLLFCQVIINLRLLTPALMGYTTLSV
ncbi:hypothetical protein O181_107450 [Austropuccinia psidii MF-1]|uniref:DUF4219 domain-containing protein n=1 Tax=Austropuccinia psidii MF-1 TaxID=1389203 RepID=A0A9Q3JQH8_9BASI|nr:hypothetical protein [Austropuccinia psidii MF-1]